MKSTHWPSYHMIWLSILLTVAHPSWAQNRACEKWASSEQASISHLIKKNSLNLEILGREKSAFLAPVDSWGRGENAKHLYVLAMRVASNEEGLNIFKELVKQNNLVHAAQWAVSVTAENKFAVAGVCTARIHSPYYARHIPMVQGTFELEVEIEKSADEVRVAEQLGATLLKKFNVREASTNLQHLSLYDLSTLEGRAAWGYEAFHEWLTSLSSDAKGALNLISGAGYRDVLPFLRGQGRNGYSSISTPQLQKLVDELDLSIDRGRIPVSVKLFRASADPFSLDAWNKLSENKNAQVPPLSDLAYTFTSLDEEWVQVWNRTELGGRGIIIEIEASAGVKAGYVDRGPHTRDYAEIILARRQNLIPVRAYSTPAGEKRLVVTARPTN